MKFKKPLNNENFELRIQIPKSAILFGKICFKEYSFFLMFLQNTLGIYVPI